MTDLDLHGPLDLMGILDLVGDGGKVLVNGAEALVEGAKGQASAPVLLPTPQTAINKGLAVKVLSSLGKTVTAKGVPLVTTGMLLQGSDPAIWPGMVLPSTKNSAPTQVKAGGLPVNVQGDSAAVFPNGGTATLDTSGQ